MAKTFANCKMCNAKKLLNYAALCKRCNRKPEASKVLSAAQDAQDEMIDAQAELEAKQAALAPDVAETEEKSSEEAPKEEKKTE